MTITSFRVQLPENIDFSHPEHWPKQSRRFKRFWQESGLVEEEEESQINSLIYAMGDQTDDPQLLQVIKITQLKQYQTVKTKFDEHLIVHRNVIFERTKFNPCRQEEGDLRELIVLSQLYMP